MIQERYEQVKADLKKDATVLAGEIEALKTQAPIESTNEKIRIKNFCLQNAQLQSSPDVDKSFIVSPDELDRSDVLANNEIDKLVQKQAATSGQEYDQITGAIELKQYIRDLRRRS